MDPIAFARRFAEFKAREETPGLNLDSVRAWAAGKAPMSPGLAKRIDKRAPGTEFIFSAITTLMMERRLSAPKARESVEVLWEGPDGARAWILPPTDAHVCSNGDLMTYEWEDSTALAARGDFYGFVAILTLVREAVATDHKKCQGRMQDLYTILAPICRISWIRQDIDLLLQCLEDIEKAFPIWCRIRHFGINWKAFREEASAPQLRGGVPPWIVAFNVGKNAKNPEHQRPVPLVEGIKPLGWVRELPPIAEDAEYGSSGSSDQVASSTVKSGRIQRGLSILLGEPPDVPQWPDQQHPDANRDRAETPAKRLLSAEDQSTPHLRMKLPIWRLGSTAKVEAEISSSHLARREGVLAYGRSMVFRRRSCSTASRALKARIIRASRSESA